MSAICAGLGSKGKVGVQRGRETAGVPSFLPTAVGTASSPPRGAARSRRPQTANPPLRFSEKLPARKGRTRQRQFECPAQSVQRKEPPRQGEPAGGSSCAPHNRCRKGAAPSGRTRQRQFECPAQPVQKRSRPVRANTLTRFKHPAGSVQKKFLENFQKS